MTVTVTGMEEVMRLVGRLTGWTGLGSRKNVDEASKAIAKQVKGSILEGKDSNGNSLAPLSKATLEGPIRREGDPQIRSASGSTPMKASGKTANSIVSTRVNADTWEVSANSDRGDMVLRSNAKQTHSGRPFGGDTPKPIRDPLQVSEKHMDLLEDEIVKGIEGALNG